MFLDAANLRLATLDQIYAWTESGDSSAAALRASRLLLRGDKAVLLQLAISSGNAVILATSGADTEFAAGLLKYRDSRSNFLSHFRSWDQDNAYDAARLTHAGDLLSSDFYRAFMEPHNLQHTIAGVIKRDPSSCILLCVYRSASEQAFDQNDIVNLRELLPHWRRAAELRNRLAKLNQQADIARCIMNHAPFAIMTVDLSGLVLYANQRAKTICELNDGLRIKDGRIIASNAASTRKLLTELAHSELQQNGVTMPIPFPLERPSGAKPYQLLIMPVETTAHSDDEPGAMFGIFVYDPTHRLPVDTAALKSLEGLTDSEARLCESLYETKNLGESAEQLNVSLSTAKTHLLNTFRKLGINSQAELMRYLAHMPKMSGEQLQ
jgi:DNA-binding CsgD family transcriptional regulator/PAS domain-containing protein